MILSSQLRAARALIDLSQEELAKDSGVSISTVRDFEAGRRHPITASIEAMRRVLEKKGVMFVQANNETGPGVCLQNETPQILRTPTKVNFSDSTLAFDIKWRGQKIYAFVPTVVLDDLGQTNYKGDKAYVAAFSTHQAAILEKAAIALYAGRVDEERRLKLRLRDFFDIP
jgi:transcriptional regulator with XRE-family HTH domain